MSKSRNADWPLANDSSDLSEKSLWEKLLTNPKEATDAINAMTVDRTVTHYLARNGDLLEKCSDDGVGSEAVELRFGAEDEAMAQ